MSLPERPLGEVLKQASASVSVAAECEYPIAGIYSFGRGLIRRPTIRGSETSYATLSRLRAGQLTMSKLNAWEGALVVVPDEFEGSYVSPEYPVFDIDGTLADPAYIAHLVRWPGLWDRLTPRGSMVRRKRTTPTTLLATMAPLPDLDEQHRIAARLDSAFRKLQTIESARARSDALQDALVDRMLSNSGTETPLSEFLAPSDDFVEVIPDTTYNTAGILSYGRGLFARPIIRGSETSYRQYNRIHTGQFVYSRLFGWEGALAVVGSEHDGYYMSHEFPSYRIIESRADIAYVSHLARWKRLHDSLSDKGTGMGSRRQRISPGRLLSTKIPLPDLMTQRRISSLLDKAAVSREIFEVQASGLKKFQSAILNSAFSGRL